MLPLLEIKDLTIEFESEGKTTPALHGISLKVNRGEILAIVGESGSGKSISSLSILRLLPSPPAKYMRGEILFSRDGHVATDLLKASRNELKLVRGNAIAMIFQEPMSSLNPVFTCGSQVQEAILEHKKISKADAKKATIRLFEKVKLPDPDQIYKSYPHQLSGGQKQRVMIAMAMSCEPALLIADEPTTALDVTVQAQILDLIRDLQSEFGSAVIIITHDPREVPEMADTRLALYSR